MALFDFLSGGSGGGFTPEQAANNQAWLDQPEELQVTPGQEGSVDSGTWDTPDSTGSGINAAGIAKALASLQTGLKDAGGGSNVQQRAAAQAGQAASGTGQGSSSGIGNLVNMLLQRQNQYFPGQPNRQPVTQSRTAGLLGF